VRKLILLSAIFCLSLIVGGISLSAPFKAAASCHDTLASDNGQLSHKIALDAPGKYTLWLRVLAPQATQDSLYARIDNGCPVMIGDGGATQGFVWLQYREFDLKAGEHTVTLAGREAGMGVDKAILVADRQCMPAGDGSNCLEAPAGTPEGSPQPPPIPQSQAAVDTLNWWVVASCAAVILLAFGFMVWKYMQFIRSMTAASPSGDGSVMIGSALSPDTGLVKKLMHFIKHHRLLVFVCSFLIAAALVVGIVLAGRLGPSFEAEAGRLSGGAKIVKNAAAIGGKYVVFEKNPVVEEGNSNQGGTNQGSSGSSGGSGQGSSGGGSSGGQSGGSSGGGGGGSSSSQSCPAYPAFPDGNCTGVPAGVSLSTYSGPCTITANNTVIDGKTVNCSLEIKASNVQIKNSRINGTVLTPSGSLAYSFTITDSEVIAPQAAAWEQTGIGEANFTALRVEVTGGNRSIYCRKSCTVRDSWVHGQNIAESPRVHASGIRQSQGATIVHNRIHCSADDTSSGGGCSANLTGYGDFEPVQDNRIEKNLFVATPGGACAYGGSSGDDGTKPYGHLASNIDFIDNVFQRGSVNNCGFYFPITDFDDSRPGSEWTNNRWEDGAVVPPAN
jgi:uncharacterized membrane protein YgcG